MDDAAEERLAEDGRNDANADAAEGEPRGAGVPAPVLREDDGVGEEAEVEDAVNYGDPVLAGQPLG